MRITSALAIGLLFAGGSVCYGKENDSVEPTTPAANSLAQEAVDRVRAQFDALRLSEKDFRLSAGWDLPMSMRAVENLFTKPLDVPIRANEWSDRLETAASPSDMFNVALGILDVSPALSAETPRKRKTTLLTNQQVPAVLKEPISLLLEAIAAAQPHLSKAVNSVTPAARQGFLELNEWPNSNSGLVMQEISARKTKEQYQAMIPFSETELYTAGQLLFKNFDKALSLLKPGMKLKQALRFKTQQGTVLINGSDDNVYGPKDLEGVVLLIDLGGKSVYNTPVAVARDNEIRLVIDFSSDVQIHGEEHLHGNAGAGIFGIGIMTLPNSAGLKEIRTGSFSQGCGIGGIGALLVKGTAHLDAQRFTQGAGTMGVGILSAKESPSSSYVATRSGQGFALTRGVGIFVHDGDKASIEGGLVQPDPREPLGSVSMCQGVGFGPRAYAGGGVGIAIVKGNDSIIKGSYFSQGVGYWHGLGIFRLRGDRCTTQARRYDMGSGVHSAFGHMDVLGNNNRIMNWGVGPSYGWDYAVGSSIVQGNENEIQNEWGAGTASIGSLSFSYISGQGNKLKLCDYGTSNIIRNDPAYSIQIIDGTENRLQCQGVAETNSARLRRLRSPWGTLQINGTTLVENLGLTPPQWTAPSREESVEHELVDLQARLKQAADKPALDEVSDLVDIAAAFSLDKSTPRQAMRQLVTLPPEKAALLINVLEPMAIDQLIQLSIAMPAHGDVTSKAILDQLPKEKSPQKKAVLLNFLRTSRPSTVSEPLKAFGQKSQTEELRVAVLRTLSSLLNKDTGEESGPRAVLLAIRAYLESPRNKKNREAANMLIRNLRVGDAFGMLATVCNLDETQRGRMLDTAPEDLTSPLNDGAKTFMTILNESRKENLKTAQTEEKVLNDLEPYVRSQFTELLQSTKPASINAAIIGLGMIGHPDDAKLLKPFLKHDNTRVRESAAVALARMGPAGVPIISEVLSEEDVRARCTVLAGLSQMVSNKCFALLEQGMDDDDPLVRLTALVSIDKLPGQFTKDRPKLIRAAQKQLKDDEDADVRLAVSLLK